MAIQYEINSIKNVPGSNEERKFVKLHMGRCNSDQVLYEHSERFAGVKRGLVKLVMSTMQDYMVEMLTGGIKFHLPEIGYFTLAVELVDEDSEVSSGKSPKGKIAVRGLNFTPEASLIRRIREGARFESSPYSTNSSIYNEVEMRKKIIEYLVKEKYLTRKAMKACFNLHQYAAYKWLNHFTETGLLVKQGPPHSPIYVLAE